MLDVLYYHAKFGGARISPAAEVAKNVEFFVCLFVTRLNVRDCASNFAMKALEHRSYFDAVGSGRFVVVQPCSTLSDCRQLATTLNAEV